MIENDRTVALGEFRSGAVDGLMGKVSNGSLWYNVELMLGMLSVVNIVGS